LRLSTLIKERRRRRRRWCWLLL